MCSRRTLFFAASSSELGSLLPQTTQRPPPTSAAASPRGRSARPSANPSRFPRRLPPGKSDEERRGKRRRKGGPGSCHTESISSPTPSSNAGLSRVEMIHIRRGIDHEDHRRAEPVSRFAATRERPQRPPGGFRRCRTAGRDWGCRSSDRDPGQPDRRRPGPRA